MAALYKTQFYFRQEHIAILYSAVVLKVWRLTAEVLQKSY